MASVLVAMSGGVDSAMTAILLQQQGFHVTGIHFKLYDTVRTDIDIRLKRISDQLGVEIVHYDARELFQKEVIAYFVEMHTAGLTPSLCARCNPRLKWKILIDTANSKGFDYVATGHYIRIKKEQSLFRIFKGADDKKDQSYYLWGLQQHVLERAKCPLGDYTKDKVKKLAANIGLDYLVKEKESTGLCFARGYDYNELLDQETEAAHPGWQPGIVVDTTGTPIGKHKGYLYYTVGQKKNLELSINQKLCVAAINPNTNVLVADTWQNLYTDTFLINNYHFYNIEELSTNTNIQTKVRGFGLNPEGITLLEQVDKNTFKVTLKKPAWAVAKGQPAVFYSDDCLLGGGIVC